MRTVCNELIERRQDVRVCQVVLRVARNRITRLKYVFLSHPKFSVRVIMRRYHLTYKKKVLLRPDFRITDSRFPYNTIISDNFLWLSWFQ